MSRPLRIEFSGAVYHITARGDRREPIYEDDEDRRAFLAVLAQTLGRFDAQCLAYCLMGNHYHLVLHTGQRNLSRVMRHLNGVYTQAFNRRHAKVGHLFQGRFKAILVDTDAYLLTLCRYVEANPVAAHMVEFPMQWPWSSCNAHLGTASAPDWLDSEGILAHVLGRPVRSDRDRARARARYAEWIVRANREEPLWDQALNQQIYLGDDDFAARMRAKATPAALTAEEVPRAQRRRGAEKTLADWLAQDSDRDQALHRAYTEGGLTMSAMARELGLSVSRVSRLIARVERAKGQP